ncbi:MAG TPA: cytochrome c [Candidatus Saccharimonadales bacterium]|nr:cytochrome c [Candidatus Saccharimonadales bacterium]
MMGRAAASCLAVGLLLSACAETPATEPVARGAQIYRQKSCASCHEIAGEGGRVGPPLTRIGTVAGTRQPGTSAEDYLRASITDPGAYIVPGFPDSMSRGLARGLPDDDLEALVRYLLSLR